MVEDPPRVGCGIKCRDKPSFRFWRTTAAPNKKGRRSRAGPSVISDRLGVRDEDHDDPNYQIFTRSSGATYSLSPGLMSNAAYQPGWLRMVPLTR